MFISDVIRLLQDIQKEHGNLPVSVIRDDGFIMHIQSISPGEFRPDQSFWPKTREYSDTCRINRIFIKAE